VNCVNCGAPMELFERRRYYYCRHCGTFHFLQSAGIDGLEVLHRPDKAHSCAICSGGLAKALLDTAYGVEYCQRCRGVLMSRATFAEIVRRRRAWASGAPVEPLPMDRLELQRQIQCPACGGRMDAHPYYGPGNVVMDSCPVCDLIWLDCGELDQIVAAPGRDRGTRDVPQQSEVVASVLEPENDDSYSGRLKRVDLLEVLQQLLS